MWHYTVLNSHSHLGFPHRNFILSANSTWKTHCPTTSTLPAKHHHTSTMSKDNNKDLDDDDDDMGDVDDEIISNVEQKPNAPDDDNEEDDEDGDDNEEGDNDNDNDNEDKGDEDEDGEGEGEGEGDGENEGDNEAEPEGNEASLEYIYNTRSGKLVHSYLNLPHYSLNSEIFMHTPTTALASRNIPMHNIIHHNACALLQHTHTVTINYARILNGTASYNTPPPQYSAAQHSIA